jgi:hypothetical protein
MVRENVLNAYRKLLTLAKLMPNKDKRFEAVLRIRKEFRANSGETSRDEIEEMLKKANSSLGFLKIMTPKRSFGEKQSGTTTMVFGKNKDGTTKKAMSNWHGGNLDPDSVKRHYDGLKRAGFRDNAHAKGIF